MPIEPRPMSSRTGLLLIGLGAILILWGLAGSFAAFFAGKFSEGARPIFILGGFEIIIVICGILSVWLGWKKREEHLGMALACLGGTVCVASFLGALSAQYVLLGLGLKPLVLARFAIGALFAACGAVAVLNRHQRSWPLFFKGLIVASPMILFTGYSVINRFLAARQPAASAAYPPNLDAPPAPHSFEEPPAGQGLSIWGPLDGSPTAVKAIVGTLIAVLCAISLCACVHIFIKAFELGRFSRERVVIAKKK